MLKNLSLILALTTASLYVFGLTYHQGYLLYWGLEETLFQLSFERTLFQGFVATSSFGANALVGLVTVSAILFLGVLVTLEAHSLIKQKEWFVSFSKKIDRITQTSNHVETPKSVKLSAIFLAVSLWVLGAFIVLLLLLIVAGHFGERAAKNQLKALSKPENKLNQISIKGEPPINASPIICSDKHCAFLIDGKTKIIPLDDISFIDSTTKQ